MPPPSDAGASRWRSCARFAALGAIYLAACRIMLSPIVNFAQLRTSSFAGDARAFIWVLAWDNHVVLDRVPSLFDANKLFPLPNALAYGEHLFGISLFTLPLYAATRNPVFAYNIVWILCYVLTAAAVHALAWRYTRDHLASMTAALAFTFCFFRMHHGHGHLNLIWCFWIPLSFIAMDRWVERPTWTRLCLWTAVIVLQALAAWYQAVLIVVADAIFFVWLLAVERRTPPPSRILLHGLAGALAAFALVWPFARYYFILHSEPPSYAAAASADLIGWFVPPENTWMGQWLLAHQVKGPRWIWGELTVYLGWITLGLASAGAIVSIRSRDPLVRRTRFFIVLGAVAAALALGPSPAEVASGSFGWSPFGMLAHVPGLSLFRIPARYTELLNLALALLAATACAALHRRFGRTGRAVTVALTMLLLSEFYLVKFPGGAPMPFPVPAVYRHIATLPPGAVLSLPDYAGTPLWFEEADYQYFSTAHWHPAVNGDAREFPPQFVEVSDRMKRFPDPSAAATMRDAGVKYVVLHAGQRGGEDLLAPAEASSDFRLLVRFDRDYLFEVVPSVARRTERRAAR
jgi:hypothetical protein